MKSTTLISWNCTYPSPGAQVSKGLNIWLHKYCTTCNNIVHQNDDGRKIRDTLVKIKQVIFFMTKLLIKSSSSNFYTRKEIEKRGSFPFYSISRIYENEIAATTGKMLTQKQSNRTDIHRNRHNQRHTHMCKNRHKQSSTQR